MHLSHVYAKLGHGGHHGLGSRPLRTDRPATAPGGSRRGRARRPHGGRARRRRRLWHRERDAAGRGARRAGDRHRPGASTPRRGARTGRRGGARRDLHRGRCRVDAVARRRRGCRAVGVRRGLCARRFRRGGRDGAGHRPGWAHRDQRVDPWGRDLRHGAPVARGGRQSARGSRRRPRGLRGTTTMRLRSCSGLTASRSP